MTLRFCLKLTWSVLSLGGEGWLICFSTLFPIENHCIAKHVGIPLKSQLSTSGRGGTCLLSHNSVVQDQLGLHSKIQSMKNKAGLGGGLWKKCLLGKHEDPNWYLSTHVTVSVVMHTCNSSTTCAETGRHAVSWGLPVSPSCLNDNFMLSERPCLKK